MSEKKRKLLAICAVVVLIMLVRGTAQANWEEDFNDMTFDQIWTFGCYPDLTGTFTHNLQDGPGDDDYLSLDETSPAAIGGSQLGAGFGSDEVFTDVRVGAVFNLIGDASWNHHGLAARTDWVYDPDGSHPRNPNPGYPGLIASCYVMVIHYEDGPENLRIELVKAVDNLTDIMATWQPEVPVPGLDHARSRYVQLDVVGSDPVYITGSIYEYKGGPLLARTPTFIDTSANDPWETPGIHDDVFASGVSGIFGRWEDPQAAGYHTTFDTVSSDSDGPAAVNPSPADGATGVSVNADLTWVEAEFAKSRELWLGREGAMEKVVPAPDSNTYDPVPPLNYGQTYQWRVDEVNDITGKTVEGYVWSFTTENLVVDDMESYTTRGSAADPSGIRYVWKDGWSFAPSYKSGSNITVSTQIDPRTTGPDVPPDDPPGPIHEGLQAMQFAYDNGGTVTLYVPGYDPVTYGGVPYYSEIEATTSGPNSLEIDPNWTKEGIKAMTLYIYGNADNDTEQMYVVLEDGTGGDGLVKCEKVIYGGFLLDLNLQLEDWQEWNIDLEQFSGVNLADVRKIYIGFGDRDNPVSGGAGVVYFDDIRLYQPRCIPALGPAGDVAEPFDCKVNLLDFAVMASGWLDDGLWP